MTTIFLSNASADTGLVEDEEEFTDAAATVFLAGGDTAATALMNLVLAILKYPRVLRCAQEEIDRVVGTDRLPSFKDREQLPYMNALCTELLRWQVIAPLAVSRCTTEEDEYRGYRIPKGTIVFPNVWAIARNEDTYLEPLDFKPERWLPGGANFNSVRPIDYVFGYGRRICPGRFWAENLVDLVHVLNCWRTIKAHSL